MVCQCYCGDNASTHLLLMIVAHTPTHRFSAAAADLQVELQAGGLPPALLLRRRAGRLAERSRRMAAARRTAGNRQDPHLHSHSVTAAGRSGRQHRHGAVGISVAGAEAPAGIRCARACVMNEPCGGADMEWGYV